MTIPAPAAATRPADAIRPLLVRRAAVLGAGTMGSRIAAHLANAGIPVLLLDLPPQSGSAEPASALAQKALAALAKATPAAFYDPASAAPITPGSFDGDLPALAGCDWVVEAVAEELEVKLALLDRVLPHLAAHAILTTNTSGLPIARLAAGLGAVRERFFGTHFFYPPRQMRLVEIVPTAETDPALAARFAAFADLRLGKTAVFAADSPNFIANRIGMALLFEAAALLKREGKKYALATQCIGGGQGIATILESV